MFFLLEFYVLFYIVCSFLFICLFIIIIWLMFIIKLVINLLGKFGNINPTFCRFSFIKPTYDIFFNNPTFTTQRLLLGPTRHKPIVGGNISLRGSTLSRCIQSSSSIHHHLDDFFTGYRSLKPNKSRWVVNVGLLKNMS